MNPRIKKLRAQSLKAVPSLSPERALLVTAFYKEHAPATQPVPIQRALAFKYILENKAVIINDAELIVGER